MASVYESDNFAGRVNYAAAVISKQGKTTRHFDTCFEMYDGDVVACALWRRAEKNPKLAELLPRYISADLKAETMARYATIPTRDLGKEARKVREKADADFKIWMQQQHAKAEGHA